MVDAELRSAQDEFQLDSLLNVNDGRIYNTNGGDISLDPAQHRASLEDGGFIAKGKGFALSTFQRAS